MYCVWSRHWTYRICLLYATNGYFRQERQQIHVRFTWATNGHISHCNRKTNQKRENEKKDGIRWSGASHFTGNKSRLFFSFRYSNRGGSRVNLASNEGGNLYRLHTTPSGVKNAPFRHDTENALRSWNFISFGMWMTLSLCRRNFPRAPNSLINQSNRNRKKLLARTRKCVGLFCFILPFWIDRMASGGGHGHGPSYLELCRLNRGNIMGANERQPRVLNALKLIRRQHRNEIPARAIESKTKEYVTSAFAFDQNIDSAMRCIDAKTEK